jgi:hypothetical protein
MSALPSPEYSRNMRLMSGRPPWSLWPISRILRLYSGEGNADIVDSLRPVGPGKRSATGRKESTMSALPSPEYSRNMRLIGHSAMANQPHIAAVFGGR